MEKLAQELIDKIIDDVDYNDLFACSLVQTRWVEPTHRRLWGSGYCSFVSKAGLQVWGPSLLLNHSTVPSRIHTLTLASTAVRGWAIYFDSVDVVFPNLRSLVIINPASGIPHYFPVLKKHFGEALESLTLCDINFIANELHSILGSIPNLRDLNISRSSLVQSPDVPPTFESPPADLQAQGKLSLTGIETHRALIPLFAKLPGVQYRSLYFSSAFQLDVGKVQQLMSACSSALETLEIRDGPPHIDAQPMTFITRDGYPELQTIRYTLPNFETQRSSVKSMLSSIKSAPKLSEIAFNFTQMELNVDLDGSGLGGWGLIDAEICRLARQATGELTVFVDFLTKRGIDPEEGRD